MVYGFNHVFDGSEFSNDDICSLELEHGVYLNIMVEKSGKNIVVKSAVGMYSLAENRENRKFKACLRGDKTVCSSSIFEKLTGVQKKRILEAKVKTANNAMKQGYDALFMDGKFSDGMLKFMQRLGDFFEEFYRVPKNRKCRSA